MTQEEKLLLLQELCARLPYGVKVKTPYNDAILRGIVDRKGVKTTIDYTDIVTDKQTYPIRYIKPYLRPMSSMTEEEKRELSAKYNWSIMGNDISIRYHSEGYWDDDTECPTNEYLKLFDWINAHHFDYRGLIEKNLALDCTGLHIYD